MGTSDGCIKMIEINDEPDTIEVKDIGRYEYTDNKQVCLMHDSSEHYMLAAMQNGALAYFDRST